MSQCIDIFIGKLAVRLELKGRAVALIGDYPIATSTHKAPDVIVRTNLDTSFLKGREKGPDYPSFQTKRRGEEELWLSRFDAEGSVTYGSKNPIIAQFRGFASPNTLEAIIRIAVSIAFPRMNTLILHSSAIEDEAGAHIFSGVSGAGKSTIAAMLCEDYPLRKLSDELLLITKNDNQWYLVVAPFSGKEQLPQGLSIPLKSINFLIQAKDHKRSPCTPAQMMGELPKHILSYAKDPETHALILELCADLAEQVSCYHLEFAKHSSVAETLDLSCT